MIEIKGLKEVVKKLRDIGENKAIADNTKDTATAIAGSARRRVPFDEGGLKQSIDTIPIDETNYLIFANKFYAGYVEFGTSGLSYSNVHVPPEMAEEAAKFKNQGSREGTLWDAIEDWGTRNGLDESERYFAYLKILQVGVEPRPYMYPAYLEHKDKYVRDLEDDLELLTK